MLIQNCQRFNIHEICHDNDMIISFIRPIIRSKIQFDCIQSAKILLASVGFSLVKTIPVVQINDDSSVYYYRNNLKSYRTAYIFSDGKIHIAYSELNGCIAYNTHQERQALLAIAKIYKKFHNTLPKAQKPSPRTVTDLFKAWINHHLINDDAKTKITNEIIPFIGTFEKRNDLGINMNLSLIFCGKPGDGKTYFSMSLARWLEGTLKLQTVEGEHLTFQKAAKAAQNFVAVIDDMNLSHFQRTGPNAEFCSNILSEMDRARCNRMFMLTTNEVITKENVDKAFFRPGRVQAIIEFGRPDKSVKQKFVDHIKNENIAHKLNISDNFLCGVEHFLLEDEFSLAEMFRLKNLVYSDCVIFNSLKNIKHYIENCRQVTVPVTTEVSYLEDI